MTGQFVDRRLHDIHFRPVRPSDWHRLQLFHRRLSDDTVELRFHGAKRDLSTSVAHHFTDLDGKNDFALVATTGTRGRIIGIASYNRVSPTCAEVALVIEDAYQHHGIGRRLMQRLREVALQNGITEFVADVLPTNLAALRLLEVTGSTQSRKGAGEVDVRVDLLNSSERL